MIAELPHYLDAGDGDRTRALARPRRASLRHRGRIARDERDQDDDERTTRPLDRALAETRKRHRAELGLAGLAGASVFASAVQRVRLRSRLLPPLEYTPGAPGTPAHTSSGGGALGRVLLRWLQPELSVETTIGDASWAPEGKPTRNYWPLVAIGATAAGGGLVYLLARGLGALLSDVRRRR